MQLTRRRGTQATKTLSNQMLPHHVPAARWLHARARACSTAAVTQPSGMWVNGLDVYELHTYMALPFEDARALCQARGGDLASIPDSKTMDALVQLYSRVQTEVFAGKPMTQGVTGSFTIGGAAVGDGATISQWRWVDGAAYRFHQWSFARSSGINQTYPALPGRVQKCLGIQMRAGAFSSHGAHGPCGRVRLPARPPVHTHVRMRTPAAACCSTTWSMRACARA